MLKNEGDTQAQNPSAAQVRVDIEEFAHAVASLEARKAEELRRLEGTVILGQAVSDLQLEVTPEELLAEVKRNRRAAENERLTKAQASYWSKLRELRFSWRVVILVVVVSFLIGWLSKPVSRPAIPTVNPYPVTILPAPPLVAATTTLSDIADGMQVYCAQDELIDPPDAADFVINLAPPAANDLSSDAVWPLVKHGGVPYTRGWVLGRPSAHFLKAQTVIVGTSPLAFAARSSPQQTPEPITFPLGEAHFNYDEVQPGRWETLRVAGLKLDKHAHEKW